MIDESDIRQICQDAINNDRKLEVILHRSDEQAELSTQLADLAAHLESSGANAVSVTEGDGTGLPALPGLTLSNDDRRNIHYMALPEGFETAPFIDALKGLAGASGTPTDEWAVNLAAITEPAELLVFIGPTCPHCPKAVRAAIELALLNDQISAVIIDVMRFPTLAEQLSIKSVPFTLLDRTLGETGVIPPNELAQRVLSRNTLDFELYLFNSMLESGKLDQATATVQEKPDLFAAAWRKSTTSSRVGLMLIAEEILEEDQAGLDSVVEALIEVLSFDDIALRGDTADILGQIGHHGAAPALEKLTSDPNPDVAEIATDSLEMIAERWQ